MNVRQAYTPFIASALLMMLVLLLIYPHYQYYIDPDGTSYLTIAKRYAAGDWEKAVNGYWSPWSCWLTSWLIKAGLEAIPASITINAIGATGFLYISQSLFLRFDVERSLQWALNITLALFLCYAVFWQSFDDLWECFFLLAALRLMLAANFIHRPVLWLLTGIAGALAYFAKAYSFPFFILNTICCAYVLCKDNKAQWPKISGVAIGVMVLCSLPWIWALHDKYGIWTTSTAGPLNASWYLVGHRIYKPQYKGLLPPVYNDSPLFWEDPYVVNGDTPFLWSSWHLFGRQLLKIGYNVYKLLESMLQLSVLFPLIAVMAWLLVASKKMKEVFSSDIFIVALSFLLFPLGYILVNFESRYIWYMLPLGMVIGALMLPKLSEKKWVYYGCASLFLLYPAWCMYDMYDNGKVEREWATELKQHNIKGGFVSIAPQGDYVHSLQKIAYFSGNGFYYLQAPKITESDLLTEMKQYGINYLYVFTYAGTDLSGLLQKAAADGTRITETGIGETNEIKVYELH